MRKVQFGKSVRLQHNSPSCQEFCDFKIFKRIITFKLVVLIALFFIFLSLKINYLWTLSGRNKVIRTRKDNKSKLQEHLFKKLVRLHNQFAEFLLDLSLMLYFACLQYLQYFSTEFLLGSSSLSQ